MGDAQMPYKETHHQVLEDALGLRVGIDYCPYCKRHTPSVDFTEDHVIPKSVMWIDENWQMIRILVPHPKFGWYQISTQSAFYRFGLDWGGLDSIGAELSKMRFWHEIANNFVEYFVDRLNQGRENDNP